MRSATDTHSTSPQRVCMMHMQALLLECNALSACMHIGATVAVQRAARARTHARRHAQTHRHT